MGRNVSKDLKLVLVARPIELNVMVCQVMPKMPGMTVGTGRRSHASYMGINPMAANDNRHHVYATNLS
jgi:hypothetical protein